MGEIPVNTKEIYLVPFPYSNLQEGKIRPVLIVSNKKYNKKTEDLIVCAISSKIEKEHAVHINTKNLCEGKLYKESIIKYDSIFKIEKTLLKKRIGTLNDKTFIEVKKKIISLF